MIEILLLFVAVFANLIISTEGWFASSRPIDEGLRGASVSWTSAVFRALPSHQRCAKNNRDIGQPLDDSRIVSESEWNDEIEEEFPSIADAEELLSELRTQDREKGSKLRHRFVEAVDPRLNPQSFENPGGLSAKFVEQGSSDGMDAEDKDVMTQQLPPIDDPDDSIFLDAENYVAYSGKQKDLGLVASPDGLGTISPPIFSDRFLQFAMPPDAPYGNDFEQASMDDLIKLKDTMRLRSPPTLEEERKIFDVIFKDEHAYLHQTSNIFREGLTNKTAAEEAAKIRRRSQYTKNLLAELNKLEVQFVEVERLLGEQERDMDISSPHDDDPESLASRNEHDSNIHDEDIR